MTDIKYGHGRHDAYGEFLWAHDRDTDTVVVDHGGEYIELMHGSAWEPVEGGDYGDAAVLDVSNVWDHGISQRDVDYPYDFATLKLVGEESFAW